MTTKTLILPEGEVTLNNDLTYMVYGENLTADQLLKVDFSHLPWLDQKCLLDDIAIKQEVNMLYHPAVLASILKDETASEYWGKRPDEALTIYKRNASTKKVDLNIERKLAKPVDPKTSAIRNNKARVVTRLEKLGYHRDAAKLYVKEFLDTNGIKYLNLTPKELATLVDEYALSNPATS